MDNQIELTVLLERVAGAEAAAWYRTTVSAHFWRWRWLGVSDPAQLADLRRIALQCGLVKPSPDPGWVINRRGEDIAALMPGLQASRDAMVRTVLAGHTPPTDPKRTFDAGTGNGVHAYELNQPWVVSVGGGLDPLFAVDGTLRNWLVEPHRAERLPGYQSQLLHETLLSAEIFSTAAFAAGWADDFDPFRELAGQELDGSILAEVRDRTDFAIKRMRPKRLPGKRVAAGVALGLLVDAIAGRVTVPNGPGFCYDNTELDPTIFDLVRSSAAANPHLPAARALAAADPDLTEVARLAERHRDDQSLPPDGDQPLRERLGRLAELIKRFAFEIRPTDERLPHALHILGNTLWSWQFFLSDQHRWATTEAARLPARQHAAIVRRWLEHPWAVVRVEDMSVLFGGDPTDPELPGLVYPLVPLLRDGVDEFLTELGGDRAETERQLDLLVERRCALRDLRDVATVVRYPETESMRQADLLIDLVTIWFYQLSDAERHTLVDAGLGPLRDVIVRGGWLSTVRRTNTPMLSRRQTAMLDEYAAAPAETALRLFEFSDVPDLVDRLDYFPLEEFWVGPL